MCRTGAVAVLTAGTGDAAVAEECRRTAELMGCYVFRLQVLLPAVWLRPDTHLSTVKGGTSVLTGRGCCTEMRPVATLLSDDSG